MFRFNLKKGLIFVDGNTRWELQRKLVTGSFQLQNQIGELLNLNQDELLQKWQTSNWLIDTDGIGAANEVLYLSTPADFQTLSDKHQKLIKRKKLYIDAVVSKNEKYHFNKWTYAIKKLAIEIGDENPPCAPTVANWNRRYKNTKSIHSLIPLSRAKKKFNLDERYKLFEDVISQLYLNKQKVAKINVVKNLNLKIERLNKNYEIKMKKPACSTVYRWLDDLEQDIVEATRLGAETARIKQRVVFGGVKVDLAGQRYELDHTPLDIIIIDTDCKLPLGRPWLTLVADYATKMVVGFYISFNHPSAHSVLQALKQAIMPKNEILNQHELSEAIWPVMGIPASLVVDNGMDLHSGGLQSACFELGIELMYVPAKTPFAKGAIERLIGTLNRELIHMLPGSTFSNIFEKGEYKSTEIAAIDFKTINKIILKWIVEIYHNRPHKSLNGKTPLEMWVEKTEHQLIELPAYPQLLDVIVGIPASRVLFHYGIELDGLCYNSRELQSIRLADSKTIKLQLKFYEDQVGYIHVLNPNTKQYFQVDCVHQEFAAIHRETYRITRALARKRYGERHTIPQLLESLDEIQNMIKQSLKDKKMGVRKFAARLRMEDTNNAFSDQVKQGTINLPELDDGLDHEIPYLKISKKGDKQ